MIASKWKPDTCKLARDTVQETRGAHMPILQDKVVLVTGAGAGIGRATALAMAEAGANVAAADIDLAAAQRTAGQAAGNARRAIAIGADCGDVASIDAMVGAPLPSSVGSTSSSTMPGSRVVRRSWT
jgi:FlaA1/EpsC-like NDP-sugar epimerase